VTETVPLPPRFLERMSRFLKEDYPAFAESLTHAAVQGLRVNTLKSSVEEYKKISPFPLGPTVPWCDSAFVLQNEDRPGKHPYHLAGLYYLQDPSAMSAAILLDPQPGERVLDLAAAPGGKTTQIASLMQGKGFLLANEIKTKRLNHLVVNVERWGTDNLVVTNETPERLADHFGASFDRVIVDAPCSGEGMFRKDMGARLDWSEEMIAGCATRQTNILRVAAHLVRPGGHLLYSTCTFAPEEDEGVIVKFLEEHADFEVESLRQQPGFMEGKLEWLASGNGKPQDGIRGAVRLFPHLVNGEGHFVCRMQRKDGRPDDRTYPGQRVKIPTALYNTWLAFRDECLDVDFLSERLSLQGDRLYYVPESVPGMKGLRVTVPGVCLGNFKKDRFEPTHPLALALRKGQAKNTLDLPAESRQVAAYLRGDAIPDAGIRGWTLVTVDGWPLGWGKRVQGVVKNHFPKGWQVYS
jgi:NOL1/NOP2/sun family putative RNA methylase